MDKFSPFSEREEVNEPLLRLRDSRQHGCVQNEKIMILISKSTGIHR